MAQAVEEDIFALTWHVENFSMCPQVKGESIECPYFVVDALEKTSWNLCLYPKGDTESDGNHVSCYVNRANKEEEPEEVSLDFNITLITSGTKSVKGCTTEPPATLKKGTGHGYPDFALIKTLSDNRNSVLPNDVFTVLCCMRRGTQFSEKPSDLVNVSASLLSNTYSTERTCTLMTDASISKKTRIEHCTLTTRIPVERILITWVIKDFKTQLQSAKKLHGSILSNLREKSLLSLSCYVSTDWDNEDIVKIDIERKDKNFNRMLIRCKVSVLGKNDVPQESREAEHLFGENCEIWSFPPVVKVSTLENRKVELLDGGALTLQCEFLISYEGEKVITINERSLSNNSIDPDSLQHDIEYLLYDKELTDVTLHAERFDLTVHKSLICARSPVFRKMFSSDTLEKRTGVVHITDIDVDTLKNIRDFIYKDRLPDFDVEHVKKLYSAADKYEILTLKKQCAASLKFNLSASNVCDILMLADLHQDGDLLKYIYSFLRLKSEGIFKSREWVNLMKTNLELAGETMRKLLAKED